MSVDIDDDVSVLTEQIAALQDLGNQPEVSEATVYDVSIRWGTALAGRLPRLLHYRDRGLLADDDAARVRRLCDQLRELTAVSRRLGLAEPRLDSAHTTPTEEEL
ncbi:hypothetical protein [Mycobacterium sp. 1274756.6]|uniref:hypothetical protein n=1 Tax=Mycobacterium sp. 1274756.6 TaxID=1834076 RepID=UPI0007FC67A8|nr:hypothetical protein [Mycobacterium sp. 1274756.6]OBJ72447.1 hypothetical protein A5643_05510 [Mycobacterium sp. 1274756.6]